ncbi:hypothetical protein FPJ27_15325 [Burkholderia sp. MS455]|uniref:hypothetical protein n=1 Tax=Burkholderia sp. MS455 TaxID=2811788 RepID=UPI0019589DB5|nr:hypothetical protein [Burkholderia sp. MS455]QRR07635.1 hypothetical protein FPJ27_15325 [Burkholderia sp. MS455]
MMMVIQALLGGLGGAAGLAVRHWKAVVALVLLSIAALVIGTLVVERDAARRQVASQAHTIATQREQIDQLQTSVTQLKQAIDQQNAAVQRLAAAATLRERAAAAALARAQQGSETLRAQIAHLNAKNRTAAAAKGRTCDDALREWRAGR